MDISLGYTAQPKDFNILTYAKKKQKLYQDGDVWAGLYTSPTRATYFKYIDSVDKTQLFEITVNLSSVEWIIAPETAIDIGRLNSRKNMAGENIGCPWEVIMNSGKKGIKGIVQGCESSNRNSDVETYITPALITSCKAKVAFNNAEAKFLSQFKGVSPSISQDDQKTALGNFQSNFGYVQPIRRSDNMSIYKSLLNAGNLWSIYSSSLDNKPILVTAGWFNDEQKIQQVESISKAADTKQWDSVSKKFIKVNP